MFAYIEGKVVAKNAESLIVDVGGIGYEIQIHVGMQNLLPALGDRGRIPVELHVREDQMKLFGFPGEEEKNLFRLVQSVSGIGPKVALNITGSISPGAFALAVLNDDIGSLTNIRGIGKKGAQRIILELKDKLRKLDLDSDDSAAAIPPADDSIYAQAVSALMVLGYRKEEARHALGISGRVEADSLEEVVLKALKTMQA